MVIFEEVRTSVSQLTKETEDDAEARNDFWSIEGDYISRHHVELRIPLKYIDVTNTTPAHKDVLQESRI